MNYVWQEIMFSSAIVCVVCYIAVLRLSRWGGGGVTHGPNKKRLDFGSRPDRDPVYCQNLIEC